MTSPDIQNSLLVQGRVLGALILREIHTINGNSKLGYLWVLIQSVFSIGVFWALRTYMGAHAPGGMSMALFLAIGFGLWSVFSEGINKTIAAVDANKALLTFPQVTEFDVMFARIIVITATQVVTTILIVIVSILWGADFRPNGIVIGLVVLICSPLCALGIGMVCGSLAVFIPVISKLVPMVLRVAFFLSGVFFSVTAFKQDLANYMLFNPILQAVELMRMSLHDAYVVEGLSVTYLVGFTLTALVIGGFLERYARSRRKIQ